MNNTRAKVTSFPHTWLAKASWRATAIKFEVPGKTEVDAQKRAENMVLRMMGGVFCLDVTLIRQLS